jgi:hypothetical protein
VHIKQVSPTQWKQNKKQLEAKIQAHTGTISILHMQQQKMCPDTNLHGTLNGE